MERCKTCRHWGTSHWLVPGLGSCDAAEDFGHSTKAAPETETFGVYTGPESSGTLLTGPEFGCVKWESDEMES